MEKKKRLMKIFIDMILFVTCLVVIESFQSFFVYIATKFYIPVDTQCILHIGIQNIHSLNRSNKYYEIRECFFYIRYKIPQVVKN